MPAGEAAAASRPQSTSNKDDDERQQASPSDQHLEQGDLSEEGEVKVRDMESVQRPQPTTLQPHDASAAGGPSSSQHTSQEGRDPSSGEASSGVQQQSSSSSSVGGGQIGSSTTITTSSGSGSSSLEAPTTIGPGGTGSGESSGSRPGMPARGSTRHNSSTGSDTSSGGNRTFRTANSFSSSYNGSGGEGGSAGTRTTRTRSVGTPSPTIARENKPDPLAAAGAAIAEESSTQEEPVSPRDTSAPSRGGRVHTLESEENGAAELRNARQRLVRHQSHRSVSQSTDISDASSSHPQQQQQFPKGAASGSSLAGYSSGASAAGVPLGRSPSGSAASGATMPPVSSGERIFPIRSVVHVRPHGTGALSDVGPSSAAGAKSPTVPPEQGSVPSSPRVTSTSSPFSQRDLQRRSSVTSGGGASSLMSPGVNGPFDLASAYPFVPLTEAAAKSTNTPAPSDVQQQQQREQQQKSQQQQQQQPQQPPRRQQASPQRPQLKPRQDTGSGGSSAHYIAQQQRENQRWHQLHDQDTASNNKPGSDDAMSGVTGATGNSGRSGASSHSSGSNPLTRAALMQQNAQYDKEDSDRRRRAVKRERQRVRDSQEQLQGEGEMVEYEPRQQSSLGSRGPKLSLKLSGSGGTVGRGGSADNSATGVDGGSSGPRQALPTPPSDIQEAPERSQAEEEAQPTAHESEAQVRPPPLVTQGSGTTSSRSEFFPMTVRFEHQETADGGAYVVTGREGQLERCEDEPIHCPGSIQAFGVLIAFDELDDGTLEVRQVSENSGFLLGIPPVAFFKARCLTDFMTVDEADALRDALDSLDERDEDPDEVDTGPLNFQLSGFGIPGSSVDHGPPGVDEGGTIPPGLAGTSRRQRTAYARFSNAQSGRFEWSCWAAIHRPARHTQSRRVILELEHIDDQINPLSTVPPPTPPAPTSGTSATDSTEIPAGLVDEAARTGSSKPAPGQLYPPNDEREGISEVQPSEEDLLQSTVSLVKPLRALARLKGRRNARRAGTTARQPSEVDIVQLLQQINEQLQQADDLEVFLKTTVGVFRELTEFDRAMCYQFDEEWNGRVVAELVDWSRTKDLYRGLNFPASDIPAQARELYKINKVRLLYDRDQPTARMCCRSREEVDTPLDMTHSYLRSMSPIHIKYLANMRVRASMSISVTAFGNLWGLIALHTYGQYGHRVSFPVRQLCKLLGDSISRNIERLSYAKRIHARKLINTAPTDKNPSGYIVAKAEDLLSLFDAEFGVLSIGEEGKILGTLENSQEILVVLEYLRQKQFTTIQASQSIRDTFPDIDYPHAFEMLAGLLLVPLSTEGQDFIVFFRRGQLQTVHWAGNPYQAKQALIESGNRLEPRTSFAQWSETVVGKSKAWTDEQLETAGVLCLVYGKFIDVWRQKENALAANQLTSLLLANASHEVRTPLNAIINYLEMALDGPIDSEVRDHLARSHAASRTLIHVINDLLDLTRTEKGQDLYLQDPFDLPATIHDALSVHEREAQRRGLSFDIVEEPSGTPPVVVGDRAKIRQIVSNVAANAVKHTEKGGVRVEWGELADTNIADGEEHKKDSIRVSISVSDTGAGISDAKLESLFREFEQVSTAGEAQSPTEKQAVVGLGLAVVARIVRNLGGQLRCESKLGEGSRFTFILPFALPGIDDLQGRKIASVHDSSTGPRSDSSLRRTALARSNSTGSVGSRISKGSSAKSEIDSLIEAMSNTGMDPRVKSRSMGRQGSGASRGSRSSGATHEQPPRQRIESGSTGSAGSEHVEDSNVPIHAVKMDPEASSVTSGESGSLGRRKSLGRVTFDTRERRGVKHEPAPSASAQSPGLSSMSSPPISSPPISSPPLARDYGMPQITEHKVKQPSSPSPQRLSPEQQSSKSPSPRHFSDYRRPSRESVPSATAVKLRVLVVEDEPINRMIIQKRLQRDGHTVSLAEHGQVALGEINFDEPNFDVVLMDLQMPICDGYEASQRIRDGEGKSNSDHRVPILAVSASLHERQRQQLLDCGIDGWILKPIDFKRLAFLLSGVRDDDARDQAAYTPGKWEQGGWLL